MLSQRHETVLVALADEAVHPQAKLALKQYCSELHIVRLPWRSRLFSLIAAFFKGIPFSSGYFYSKSAHKIIEGVIQSTRPDHIYCQLTRMSEYVRRVRHIQRTLDYQDAFSMAFKRRAQREAWYARWLFKMEERRLERYEAHMLDEFENVIIISAQDRDCIKHGNKGRIVVVPNGVDLDHFRPRAVDKQCDLLFAGNMAYPPNVESVEFLVQHVLPIVWKSLPNATLLIAGASPTRSVLSLACERVLVSGFVDDISETYARARVFVAPMLISTGLQNKLLEAMATGLPCVTSELANNAVGGTHGKNVLVCSSPEEYARAIIDLLTKSELATSIASAGRKFVHDHYSWENATRPLFSIIESGFPTLP
jgi:sugar transferase (PEP-CTERM/EpsH1 system associated)